VKTKIAGLKTKKTKSTRVKESWKMKADKVKAKRKDLKRSETKREEEKEIKRRQAKAERSPAQKDSIFIPFALAVAFLIFISFIEFVSSFAFLIFPVHFNYQFIYPFRKFAFLDFKEFKDYCLYNIKPYIWQREQKLVPQSLKSTRLPRNPETRSPIPVRSYTGTHWFQQHYKHLGQIRISENNVQYGSIQSLPRST